MKGEMSMDNNNLNKNLFMLLGTFLLGILFVFLFYGNSIGVSAPIFVVAFYAVMIYYNRDSLSKTTVFGWFLALPILLLSCTYFFYGNLVFYFLNIMALPILILLQTLLVTDCICFKWYHPGILLDLFLGVFYRCFVHINKPFKLLSATFRGKNGKHRMNPIVGKVLVGLLISIPLVLLLIGLLASADAVFSIYVDKIPNIFSSIRLDDLIAKGFIVLLIFFLSFSYLWSLGAKERPGSSIAEEIKGNVPKVFDPAMVITIMTTINVVYISFVLIQFAYLFGGSNFALPSNFTYAEYARKGFFELIAVTIINLLILACFLNFTKKKGSISAKVLGVLYSLMVLCTFVMLISAHFRMSLYEDAYGFTYLRMFTHCFMVFLFILFIITLARIWSERVKLLRTYIVVAIAAFVIINYINVDAIIAGKNVERYEKHGEIDIQYLTNLSYDAVPELVKLADCKDPKIAADVNAYLEGRKKELSKYKPWQSGNLAEFRAKRSLEAIGK
jgi:hypothetical protein